MSIPLTMAMRYLMGRKLRALLTTLAILFGTMVIFGMNLILPSMTSALQTNMLAASGQVDLTITRVTGDLFDESLVAEVSAMQGVRAVTGSLNRTLNLPADYFDQDASKPDPVSALTLVGIDLATAETVRSYPLQEGRFLQPGDTNAVVITESLADKIGVGLGETFDIPTVKGAQTLTVVGIQFPRMLPGNEEILVPLSWAQEMMAAAGKINLLDANLDLAADETRRAEISAAVQARLGEGFEIGTQSAGQELASTMQMGQIVMNLFGALALFMGAFIIFNTFRTVVLERRHDIGLLRAVGASRRMILWVIVLEGLIQGVIGSVLGIVAGYFLGLGVVHWAQEPMSTFINLQLQAPAVPPVLLVVCLLLGVGVSILAGLFPALQAARLTPLDALRPSLVAVDYRRRMGFSFIIGAVFIGLALLALFSGDISFIGIGAFVFLVGLVLITPALVRPLALLFGRLLARLYARQGTGDIAQGNLARQPGRVATTVSATMLGLAVIVALGGMVASLSITMTEVITNTLGSDYLFIPPSIALWGSDVGASADFEKELRDLDSVEMVSALRFAPSQVDENSVSVLGIDPQAYPQVSGLSFTDGSEDDYVLLNDDNSIFINGILAMTLGVKKGDTIELMTPYGRKPYRIAAIAGDLLNAKVMTVYISHENLQRDFNVSEDVFIQLNLKPGADKEAADTAIRALAADYPQFTVVSGEAYYKSLLAQVQAAFAGMYFLLAFIAVPSLIAMLNTLAIAVIERTREIGMLRAVGATRRQVRGMITAEALLMAAIGSAFGILGGLYLGYVLVLAMQPIMPSPYVFPVAGILAAVVIGLVFGSLAAVIPARQAAKLDVVTALRYE